MKYRDSIAGTVPEEVFLGSRLNAPWSSNAHIVEVNGPTCAAITPVKRRSQKHRALTPSAFMANEVSNGCFFSLPQLAGGNEEHSIGSAREVEIRRIAAGLPRGRYR